jgi:SNF2 family DNA or RNA helicase
MHDYQLHGVEHVIQNPFAGLLMQMGLGKTVTVLTAIDKLMNQYLDVNKVLVIAPKTVAEHTWPGEPGEWKHLKHLRVNVITGTEQQRKGALRREADVHVISCNNVVWLIAQYAGGWPFDMVVIDESSKFKSHKAKRFRALRQVHVKVSRLVILTGTPAPKNLIDLWSQVFLLDRGKRLYDTIGAYRERYFNFNPYDKTRELKEGGVEQAIYDRIGDICISMKTEDYLELPARIDSFVQVHLSPAVRKQYHQFEREQIIELFDQEVTAVNAAVLSGKLRQFASGAVYIPDEEGLPAKRFIEIHDEKIEALAEVIEAACGQPVLVFYTFQHELRRIMNRLKSYKPRQLTGPKDIAAWNNGEIELCLAHPASTGHGLNLQKGGNIIVWFSPDWNLEYYQQANARLHRQGQTKPVFVHHLICPGTLDEDVMISLGDKAGGQDALMNAIKARVRKHVKIAA